MIENACKKGKEKSLIPLLDIQIFYQDQERREVELAELNSLEEKFVCAQRWKTEFRAYSKVSFQDLPNVIEFRQHRGFRLCLFIGPRNTSIS